MLARKRNFMFRAYKYVYYRIYDWNLRTWGQKDRPHDNAVLGVAMLTLFNLFSVFAILQILTDIDFLSIGSLPVEYLAIFVIAHMSLHYLLLFYKKRYKQIIAEFSQESKEDYKRGTVWVLVYIIGSPLLLIASVLLTSYFR